MIMKLLRKTYGGRHAKLVAETAPTLDVHGATKTQPMHIYIDMGMQWLQMTDMEWRDMVSRINAMIKLQPKTSAPWPTGRRFGG